MMQRAASVGSWRRHLDPGTGSAKGAKQEQAKRRTSMSPHSESILLEVRIVRIMVAPGHSAHEVQTMQHVHRFHESDVAAAVAFGPAD
jgi:hypothetical protein